MSMCCYCLVSVLDLIICTLLVTNVWNLLVSLYSVFRVGPKVLFNSLSPAPRAVDVKTSTTKKNRKKLRYFRLPPNLAHRKLIALANYVPSSSPLRVLSFMQRFFKNVEKWRCVVRSIWDVFALNESLYRQISNSSQADCFEGFWRITSKTNAKIEVRKQ